MIDQVQLPYNLQIMVAQATINKFVQQNRLKDYFSLKPFIETDEC